MEKVEVLTDQFVIKMIGNAGLSQQEGRQIAKEPELNERYATYDEAKAAGAALIKRYKVIGARFTIELQFGYVSEAEMHTADEQEA